MDFEPEIMENGDIRVYARAQNGTLIGDGMYVLKKGTPEHAAKLAEMKKKRKRDERITVEGE